MTLANILSQIALRSHSFKFFLISLLLCSISLTACQEQSVAKRLARYPQNASQFLNPDTENQPLISATLQQQLMNDFIKHFFSPWTHEHTWLSVAQIKQAERVNIQTLTTNASWGANLTKYDAGWLNQIIQNMQLTQFPNHLQYALTVNNSYLRVLPTADPAFNNPQMAGEGYPFDNLQESTVPPNTPVYILQQTRDTAWQLVLLHNDLGWLPSQDLAIVSQGQQRQWQRESFLAITHEKVAIHSQQHFRFTTQIGAIFPVVTQTPEGYHILIAVRDTEGNAQLQTAVVPYTEAVLLPLTLTPKNVATIINRMLGQPYGWGGLLNYRDCSATLRDLFTPFAIWLPRNSRDQIRHGTLIDLSNATPQQKLQTLQQAKPFITLLGMPGHIMLYLGQLHNQYYVLQTIWGIHTKSLLGNKGRIIIGKTVITPLDLDQHLMNVPLTWLDKINGIASLW